MIAESRIGSFILCLVVVLPYVLCIAQGNWVVNRYLNRTLTKFPSGSNMVQTLRPTVLTVVRVCHHVSASASVSTNTVFHSNGPVGFSAGGLENCVLTCHIWILRVALCLVIAQGKVFVNLYCRKCVHRSVPHG
jgi:hypothetical protein